MIAGFAIMSDDDSLFTLRASALGTDECGIDGEDRFGKVD